MENSEIIDSDDHTFDIVYTSDMSMIHRFSDGKMNIVEGRMITPKDVENKASVCVISSAFAAMNGLSVGDRLSFYLGTELLQMKLADEDEGLNLMAGVFGRRGILVTETDTLR